MESWVDIFLGKPEVLGRQLTHYHMSVSDAQKGSEVLNRRLSSKHLAANRLRYTE